MRAWVGASCIKPLCAIAVINRTDCIGGERKEWWTVGVVGDEGEARAKGLENERTRGVKLALLLWDQSGLSPGRRDKISLGSVQGGRGGCRGITALQHSES